MSLCYVEEKTMGGVIVDWFTRSGLVVSPLIQIKAKPVPPDVNSSAASSLHLYCAALRWSVRAFFCVAMIDRHDQLLQRLLTKFDESPSINSSGKIDGWKQIANNDSLRLYRRRRSTDRRQARLLRDAIDLSGECIGQSADFSHAFGASTNAEFAAMIAHATHEAVQVSVQEIDTETRTRVYQATRMKSVLNKQRSALCVLYTGTTLVANDDVIAHYAIVARKETSQDEDEPWLGVLFRQMDAGVVQVFATGVVQNSLARLLPSAINRMSQYGEAMRIRQFLADAWVVQANHSHHCRPRGVLLTVCSICRSQCKPRRHTTCDVCSSRVCDKCLVTKHTLSSSNNASAVFKPVHCCKICLIAMHQTPESVEFEPTRFQNSNSGYSQDWTTTTKKSRALSDVDRYTAAMHKRQTTAQKMMAKWATIFGEGESPMDDARAIRSTSTASTAFSDALSSAHTKAAGSLITTQYTKQEDDTDVNEPMAEPPGDRDSNEDMVRWVL